MIDTPGLNDVFKDDITVKQNIANHWIFKTVRKQGIHVIIYCVDLSVRDGMLQRLNDIKNIAKEFNFNENVYD